MTDPQYLIAAYVQTGSETAFRELVARYVDLVYSTALRLVGGDAHRAEDVAQTVFLNLARVARTLPPDVKLGGWLHRDTCFTAATLMRGERRRQSRERQAVEMNALQPTSDPDFKHISPLLDEAINELGEADRTAILLRFFEQHDFRSVGEALGSNEDAARMRVKRALEKLQELLKRRGLTSSAAALSVALSTNAVQAAPVGLALTISAAALTGTTLATTASAAATKAIAMTALQKTIVTTTIAVLAGAGIYEARQASQLRDQVQTLQRQQAPLAGQIQNHEQEREDGARQLAALQNENERLKHNNAELLKLRGEAARLRNNSPQLAKPNNSISTNAAEVALTSWLNRVKEFKQLPERMPDKTIPELRLLTEEDWLELAKKPLDHEAGEVNLDDDEVARLVFSAVRAQAKDKLMRVFSRALEGYAKANGDQLPTDTLQLKPHLMNSHFQGPARVVQIPESAVDDTVLRRYEILRTGKLAEVPDDATILAEKAPVDSKYDTRLRVGRFWMGVHGSGIEDYSAEDGTKTE